MALFRVGTSGWNYPHWKGVFYPEKQPKARWLEHYYRSAYGRAELEGRAEKLLGWDRDAYVYFDNDFEGNAVANAAGLREMLSVPE